MGLWRCDKCGLTANAECPLRRWFDIPPADNANHEWEIVTKMLSLERMDVDECGFWGYARVKIVNDAEIRFFTKTMAEHPGWWAILLCDHKWKRDEDDLQRSPGEIVLVGPNARTCNDKQCKVHTNMNDVSVTLPVEPVSAGAAVQPPCVAATPNAPSIGAVYGSSTSMRPAQKRKLEAAPAPK